MERGQGPDWLVYFWRGVRLTDANDHCAGRTLKQSPSSTLRSCRLFTGLPCKICNRSRRSLLKSLEKDAYLFHEGDVAAGFLCRATGW